MTQQRLGFILILLAVGVLALTTMSTVTFLPGQTATFNVSEYCSQYRNQFNVTYCPAETTTTEAGLLNLSGMSSIQIVAVVVAAVMMLCGVIVLMIARGAPRR